MEKLNNYYFLKETVFNNWNHFYKENIGATCNKLYWNFKKEMVQVLVILI